MSCPHAQPKHGPASGLNLSHLQVKLIKEKVLAAMGEETAKMIDINTIDGFQVCLGKHGGLPGVMNGLKPLK